MNDAPIALPAPTNVRWRILALLMAYAGLVHFNRISISVAGTEHIMQDYEISETQMGMVYSSYLFIYTLCMTPGGWLIDRIGPKKALMLLGFGSAILVPMTGLTGYAAAGSILLSLFLIRSLLGVVSTPIHPGAARAVSFWMPPKMRGVANGMVTGAAVLGIASTYYAFGGLMDAVGWPNAFLVAGGVTLALTLAWTFYATDRPEQHPGVNAAELRIIGPSHEPAQSHAQDGFLSLLLNRNLILLTLSYAALSYFQYLFFYWLQYYFDKVLMLGKDDGRLYATIPMLGMAAGMMAGGAIADKARARFRGRVGWAITPSCGLIFSAIFLVLGTLTDQPAWVVTCFALSMGALGVSEPSFWVVGVEIGKKRGGLSAAILNTGGNAGGIPGPLITPLISAYFGWQTGLWLASGICVLGAALWWWIRLDETAGASRGDVETINI